MTFPYISQIQVHDCYASKNFEIPATPLDDFKHIILTGKNGAGKTTILRRIAQILSSKRSKEIDIRSLIATRQANPGHTLVSHWNQQIFELESIDLKFLGPSLSNYISTNRDKCVFAYFRANRLVNVEEVKSVSKEAEFLKNLEENPDKFNSLFKQYLVNKKIYEAFDFMNNEDKSKSDNAIFFASLTQTLRSIFGDPKLELEFVQEEFEFFLRLQDGRLVTFNQLSEGFSAFISIIMDLLMRVDLVRKSSNDYSLNPEGVVLIDEPETHFHLSMQYEILPLLTNLFPKFQFIIATHSPAVISSIKNAVVFDITTKQELHEVQVGSSYSELMIKHFGLDNEFSPIADQILLEVAEAVESKNVDKLRSIILENDNYLTPSLRFEIESQIISIQAKYAK